MSDSDSLDLTNYFPNEFVGRFGKNIFRFHQLNSNDLFNILDLEINKLGKKYGIKTIAITKEAKRNLIDSKACAKLGVRALQTGLSKIVEPQLIEIKQNGNLGLLAENNQVTITRYKRKIRVIVKEI